VWIVEEEVVHDHDRGLLFGWILFMMARRWRSLLGDTKDTFLNIKGTVS
jgi:hypothetical protein